MLDYIVKKVTKLFIRKDKLSSKYESCYIMFNWKFLSIINITSIVFKNSKGIIKQTLIRNEIKNCIKIFKNKFDFESNCEQAFY